MNSNLRQQRLLLGVVIAVGALILLFVGCTAAAPSGSSGGDGGASVREEFADDVTDAPSHQAVEQPATPAPQSAPTDESSAVRQKVESLVAASPYNVAVCFIDPTDEANDFSVNGDRSQLAASMIKLGVLLYVMNQIDAGQLALTDTYALAADDIVPGTGAMQYDPVGTIYTVSDLIELMIAQSDNTATNVLIDKVGREAVNAYCKGLSLDVDLNKKLMVSGPEYVGVNNFITADACSKILEMVYDGSAGSPALLDLVNQALLDQYDSVGIIDGLPANTKIGHKTGTLESVKNDGAIVYAPHPYILTIMVEGTNGMEDSAALDLMANISEVVYDFTNKTSSNFAGSVR